MERLAVCGRGPLLGHSPFYSRGLGVPALPRQLSNVRVDLLHL
jgi:hypothetical protein